MYEQYLRDPASVGEEWRQLFDNGKLAELPVIPTSAAEALREAGGGSRETRSAAAPVATPPVSPLPSPGLTPITGRAARLAQNMTDSLSVPTATSFREITVDVLDARRRELNAQLAAAGKKISFTHLIGYAIARAARELPVMTHAFRDIDGKPHRLSTRGARRPGGGRGEEGRQPRPGRPRHQARRGHGLRDFPRDIRGAGRQGAH